MKKEQKIENRRTFRLSDADMEKLAAIAKHHFGTADKNQTAALKIAVEAYYSKIKQVVVETEAREILREGK